MRLPPENLNTSEQLAEFDQWLTAKLERIKDSEKFNSEITSLCKCIEALSPHLNNFSDHSFCTVENLSDAIIKASQSEIVGGNFLDDEQRVSYFYKSLFNLLFLTSGATDNNLKNHFLIKLKEDDIKQLIPKRGASKKKIKFSLVEIPSTTKSEFIAKTLASCYVGSHEKYQSIVTTEPTFDLKFYLKLFLKEYIGLILEDEEEFFQFWAVCNSFVSLNQHPTGKLGIYLLNSCTIFKVRGSVSASGGHLTETILRNKLITIGLTPGNDFNINDVTIGEVEIVEDGKRKKKTRAYDFILPYKIENWEPKPKLFIQSQFYAGDSGSVSHKVVDQTQSSRTFTISKYKNARFVEYLDGAGYYASLRGDLEHMLSFNNTASFFQVKSILLRLRRELQQIEFLTPVEFEHAILRSQSAAKKEVYLSLKKDGYPDEEIERITNVCVNSGYVHELHGQFKIDQSRVDIARRLLILDIAANNSSPLSEFERISQKYILIPGYGPSYGLLESTLSILVCSECKQFLMTAPVYTSDIEWLLDEGVFRRH